MTSCNPMEIEVREPKPNRVLFLDIDGVMNSLWSWAHVGRSFPGNAEARFDPQSLALLQELVAVDGFHVVISSSWRRSGRNDDMARWLGLPREALIGITPQMSGWRGTEIATWMAAAHEAGAVDKACSFVIVDDDGDMHPWQRHFFVQTLFMVEGEDHEKPETLTRTGLQAEHIARIREIVGIAA